MTPREELYVLEFYDPEEAEHPLAVRRPGLEYADRIQRFKQAGYLGLNAGICFAIEMDLILAR